MSLSWLVAEGTGTARPADASRRRALLWVGAASLGLAAGGSILGRAVRRLTGPNIDVEIRAADDRYVVPSRAPFPDIDGLSPETTSPADHYVVDIDLVDPAVEATDWLLSVRGLIEKPLTLSFNDLQSRFLLVEDVSVLTCISNEVGGDLVGSSRWTGIRLGDVLTRAGLADQAVDIIFRAADGYTDSLPVESALDPSVILARSRTTACRCCRSTASHAVSASPLSTG